MTQPVPGLHENFAEDAAMSTDKAMVTDAAREFLERAKVAFLWPTNGVRDGEMDRFRDAYWNLSAALAHPPAKREAGENELRETLRDLERYVALNCYDQWLPEGHAKTSQLSRLLDRSRAALEASHE